MACQKVCKQGRDDIIVKVNLQSLILTLTLTHPVGAFAMKVTIDVRV